MELWYDHTGELVAPISVIAVGDGVISAAITKDEKLRLCILKLDDSFTSLDLHKDVVVDLINSIKIGMDLL